MCITYTVVSEPDKTPHAVSTNYNAKDEGSTSLLQRHTSDKVEPKLLVDFRQFYVFCTCKTIFFLSLVERYRIGLTEDGSSAKTTVTIRKIK